MGCAPKFNLPLIAGGLLNKCLITSDEFNSYLLNWVFWRSAFLIYIYSFEISALQARERQKEKDCWPTTSAEKLLAVLKTSLWTLLCIMIILFSFIYFFPPPGGGTGDFESLTYRSPNQFVPFCKKHIHHYFYTGILTIELSSG